jgi:uncharacterized RDD family membrane protein YckC
MSEGRSEGPPSRPPQTRPATSRLLGAGARGVERLASVTGADRALEDAMEEAIVRALRSPAVERAIERLIERNAVQEALQQAIASDEFADALVHALEGEMADRVWREVLASNQAQMLVERIAEAPEVRAAIAQQGVGLLTDIGRRLTAATEVLDDAAERLVQRMLGRPAEETETDQVGLVTRALATAADLALLGGVYWIASGVLASIAPLALGRGGAGLTPLAAAILGGLGFMLGCAIFVLFWALVGQTPGMRFLSIRLEASGTNEIGFRRAIARLLAALVALLPAGLGFLAILVSPERRGWHDRIAGTTVVYDTRTEVAPWAVLEGRRPSSARPGADLREAPGVAKGRSRSGVDVLRDVGTSTPDT